MSAKAGGHQGTKHSDPVATEAPYSPKCQPQELGVDSLNKKELKVITSVFLGTSFRSQEESGMEEGNQMASHLTNLRWRVGRGDGAVGEQRARRTESSGESEWM